MNLTDRKKENSKLKSSNDSTRSIIMIGSLFFIFGFVTWLNSVLIPYLKIACELSNFESYLVAFAFYIAYLVMAIPSAWVLKMTGFKKGMSVGLVVMALGALTFIPAALTRTYYLFLIGLFIQGTGLAVLQTAANPYITILGPIESAAKRMSIMGVCNKVAGGLAPIVLGAIALSNTDELVANLESMNSLERVNELNQLAARVIIPYLIMTGILVALAILIFYSSLPEVDTDKNDKSVEKYDSSKKSIMQFPHLLLGTLAMFFYIGVEVIAGDTVISYGLSLGFEPKIAKFFTTYTLVAMIVGYFIGIITIPKYLSQQKALIISAILGVIFSIGSFLFDGFTSVLLIALLGLANALVFPAIWPLALDGLGRFTKLGSSLLIMALAGGAILPLLYGYLADLLDAQMAYLILIPCYLYILFFAVKGYKIRTT
ncbi:sugar MFS transporter [Autumnicola musiva]|uniref:Sugar MFS transporter n=1 Tax=Autumnicola musiva TaxID=3075589 RepID=A0ABU3DAJ4_9FLAO|nr:sugar MFS transporter [Zunongwangia sp. F117]MDT0678555.1 sugar MFS transporter [Zunongwangia sp. F117]